MFEINWIAVLVAAVVIQVLGFVWYMPSVFGGMWAKASGIDINDPTLNVPMAPRALAHFVLNIILVTILSVVLQLARVTDLADAFTLTFMLWLGLVVTTGSGSVIWGKSHINLLFVNHGHWLVMMLISAAIFHYIA